MNRTLAPRLTRTLLAMTVLACLCLPVHAARLALVIGNADYVQGRLKNPVNDARAIDAKLALLGFSVQRVENLKRNQIGRTLNGFVSRIKPGDDVVVFYAGHGLQVKGVNFLPAVDADIQSEDDIALYSVNLNALMDRLDGAKAGLKLLFLDACRNNPYARSFRGGERGLARVGAAPTGTLLHFATRPGSVAADGDGANGLYTSQLLRHLGTPGLPVEAMLKRVTMDVESASQGQQEPWSEGRIRGDFYFNPAAHMEGERAGGAMAPEELAAWRQASDDDSIAAYANYLEFYPQGYFAPRAREAHQALQEQARSREEAAMLNTRGSWGLEEYRRYLSLYPAGSYADAARDKLAAYEKEDAEHQRSAEEDRRRRSETNLKRRETECSEARNPYNKLFGGDKRAEWLQRCLAQYPVD